MQHLGGWRTKLVTLLQPKFFGSGDFRGRFVLLWRCVSLCLTEFTSFSGSHLEHASVHVCMHMLCLSTQLLLSSGWSEICACVCSQAYVDSSHRSLYFWNERVRGICPLDLSLQHTRPGEYLCGIPRICSLCNVT